MLGKAAIKVGPTAALPPNHAHPPTYNVEEIFRPQAAEILDVSAENRGVWVGDRGGPGTSVCPRSRRRSTRPRAHSRRTARASACACSPVRCAGCCPAVSGPTARASWPLSDADASSCTAPWRSSSSPPGQLTDPRPHHPMILEQTFRQPKKISSCDIPSFLCGVWRCAGMRRRTPWCCFGPI